MSLNGTVTASESALTQDLVPALAIAQRNPLSFSTDHTHHFVKGDVEGSFPNAFTLRVYDPPPAEALFEFIEGESPFVEGELVAISPAHPTWLKTKSYEIPVEGGATERIEMCSEVECISSMYEGCENYDDPVTAPWPCGDKLPERLNWDTYGVASKHRVGYFARDVPAGTTLAQLLNGGKAFAAGYQVLEMHPEAAVQDPECFERANERSKAAWGDTMEGLFGGEVVETNTPEDSLEFTRLHAKILAEEHCPPTIDVVDDRSAVMELEFVDQLSSSLGFGL